MMALRPGTYDAIVTEHHWTTSQSGNPGLAVQVDIDDRSGEFTAMVGVIWFTPKSMGMARGQLRALGFDPDRQQCKAIGETISLVDARCEVQIVEEEYRGRTSIKISRFGGIPKPPTQEQLAGLDALLAAAKKTDEREDDFSTTKPAPPPPKLDEDGVPF